MSPFTSVLTHTGIFCLPTFLYYSDRKLNFDKLSEIVDFHRHDVDYVTDPQELVALVKEANAEIVITKEMKVPAECVAQFPNTVKLLCEAGTGYNNIPIPACQARKITVCNIPTYSTQAVAHMAITYVMNFSIQMMEQQRMLQNKDRSNFTGPFTLPLHEINGSTIGLVGGAGMIGTKVAEIALALGMKVIISSRKGTLPEDHALYNHPMVTVVSDLSLLLKESDYVSLHTPLNDQTRGSFGRAELEQMKSSAYLINTSRGAVCNEAELIACLQEGVIAGAGLDVTTNEPAPMHSPLWDMPNVWMTPHIGWRRLETRQRLVDMTYDNIKAYCEAKSPDDYINVVS